MLSTSNPSWPSLTKKSRQSFRHDEDIVLTDLVHAFGEHNWQVIAAHMNDRSARQCRDRWKFYLCPSVNRSPWTSEEDRLLLTKYREIGGKWSKLCEYFRNRSLNNVKNRWNSVIRKVRALGMNESSDFDWLRCAGLVTQPSQNAEDLASPSDDPAMIFQIAHLLNNPAQPARDFHFTN
jgi:hypothetical protein